MSSLVTRCVCFNVSLASLKDVAAATGATTLTALQTHIAFGAACQLCHPYVTAMLASGATAFLPGTCRPPKGEGEPVLPEGRSS
jgi:bacterioferritin-associated ferredoxin